MLAQGLGPVLGQERGQGRGQGQGQGQGQGLHCFRQEQTQQRLGRIEVLQITVTPQEETERIQSEMGINRKENTWRGG